MRGSQNLGQLFGAGLYHCTVLVVVGSVISRRNVYSRSGAKTARRVPNRAILIPTFSLVVTCSFKNVAPSSITTIGAIEAMSVPESEVVLSKA